MSRSRDCALARSLAVEYPELRQIAAETAPWDRLLAAPLAAPPASGRINAPAAADAPQDLLITGMPSSGAEWLCDALRAGGRTVVYDEPAELRDPLAVEAVPWTVAVFHRRARASAEPSSDPPHSVATLMAPGYLLRITSLRRAMPRARIVVCVDDPFSAIAAWKGGPAALRDVDLAALLPGHLTQTWLTGQQLDDLALLANTPNSALRRALWWRFLAELILDHQHEVTLLRWDELRSQPATVLRTLTPSLAGGDGACVDTTLPPLRDRAPAVLDEVDTQAIRAVCSQTAFELGVWPRDLS